MLLFQLILGLSSVLLLLEDLFAFIGDFEVKILKQKIRANLVFANGQCISKFTIIVYVAGFKAMLVSSRYLITATLWKGCESTHFLILQARAQSPKSISYLPAIIWLTIDKVWTQVNPVSSLLTF